MDKTPQVIWPLIFHLARSLRAGVVLLGIICLLAMAAVCGQADKYQEPVPHTPVYERNY